MESGIDNNIPLLTIAIPTWNRANSLNTALEHLLPQIESFSNQIELIISDNGSEDDTQIIVNKFINEYPQLNIISNRNTVNLGFFGNFKKCRNISSGKYLWILSDDDFVCEKVITEIINRLLLSKEIGILYLKNNKHEATFKISNIDRNQLLTQEAYNIGLISRVLFLNRKEFDETLYEEFHNSAFIGFIFLLNSFNFNKHVIVIEGNCLKPANEVPKGYNFFDIFINHMEHVINYMHIIHVPTKVIYKYRCLYLKYFISPRYLLLKLDDKLGFGECETSTKKEIEYWIYKLYSDLRCYWTYFYPIKIISSSFLSISYKLRNKLKIYK